MNLQKKLASDYKKTDILKNEIKRLVDETWKNVKKTTHPDDLASKTENYKAVNNTIDTLIEDLKVDIDNLLRQ